MPNGSDEQRYRLIAIDVDGTLIDGRRTVSPRMVSAISESRETGAIISLATGRMLRSALKFADEAGANGPVICHQGALTVSPGGREVMRSVRLGATEVMDSLRAMRAAGAHINAYVDGDIYVEEVGDWASGYAERMETELRVVNSLDTLAESGPLALLGVVEPDASELVDHVRSAINGRARVTHSLQHFCEVGPVDGGKQAALEDLAGRLGVPRESVLAFGDGQGDEGMVEWAGLGVAVGDAHIDVSSVADISIEGPEIDGPAQLLEQLLKAGRIGN